MISFGLLSFVQITFLPGIIICRWFNINSLGKTVVFSLALSHIYNYLLVFLLTSLGIYTRSVILSIFCLEIILALYVFRKQLSIPLRQRFQDFLEKQLVPPDMNSGETHYRWRFSQIAITGLVGIGCLVALVSIIYYLVAFVKQIGMPFEEWDAVVSWNRWAADWYHNQLPSLTWNYPQLLPANWSVTYQFLGTDSIQWIAKSSTWIFEIYLLVLFFILALEKRSTAYFWGAFFSAFLLWQLGSLGNGYADTPVAFFSFLSFSCLLFARDEKDFGTVKRYLLLGIILAAGAAVTKQVGLMIAGLYPFLAFLLLPKSTLERIHKSEKKLYLFSIVIYALIIGAWYTYNTVLIRMGVDQSPMQQLLQGAHNNRTYIERLVYGVGRLKNDLSINPLPGIGVLTGFLLLMAFSMRQKIARTVIFPIVIPYFFIWAFLFSYDLRNMTLILPFAGLAAGFGFKEMCDVLGWIFQRVIRIFGEKTANFILNVLPGSVSLKNLLAAVVKHVNLNYLLILLAILLALLPLKVKDSFLLQQAFMRQTQVGSTLINDQLYAYYYDHHGFDGKILTDYQILAFLPYLKEYYAFGNSGDISFIEKSQQPEIGYVVFCPSDGPVLDYFDTLVAEGKAKNIMDQAGWRFIRIFKDTE